MFERGWISDPETKARSVVVFADTVRLSRELFEQQFGTIDPPTPGAAPPRLRQGQPSPRCKCGGGTAMQGRTFVPGHDQKLRVQLENRIGGQLQLRDLLERRRRLQAGVNQALTRSFKSGPNALPHRSWWPSPSSSPEPWCTPEQRVCGRSRLGFRTPHFYPRRSGCPLKRCVEPWVFPFTGSPGQAVYTWGMLTRPGKIRCQLAPVWSGSDPSATRSVG